MGKTTLEKIGTLTATRETDGQDVTVDVYREWLHVTYSEGTTDRADNGRKFRLGTTTLRVDGNEPEYLTDGRTRYKLSAPLSR